MLNYRYPSNDQEFEHEYEMELNPEFEFENDYENDPGYEMENSYGMHGESELETGSDYEFDPEFEMANETDDEGEYMQNEYDQEEGEFGDQYETQQDEMEAELEYVTNEQEFENWVNEIVVRDHRRLKPILRTPIGRRAIRHFSKIAFKTLPYIGRRRTGWKRPYKYRPPYYYNRFRRPGYKWWQNRQRWGNIRGVPPLTYQYPNVQQPGVFQNTDGQQQPAIQQDGSFRNFVLDTFKNLSEQIARGNESIMALKDAMTNSAANNFPAIVQPKTDSADQPATDSQQGPANQNPAMSTTGKDNPAQGEFEWQENEYDNEAEFEYDNEAGGGMADSESNLSDEAEMELASELLSVNNEMELDYFFGKLARKLLRNATKFLATPQGILLKKALKSVVGKALPIIGGVVAGPAGAAVGNAVESAMASEFFNLELEGLSNEDSEFETAKAFVRFAANAAQEAHDNATGDPAKDTEHALINAARRFAPGLIRPRGHRHHHHSAYGFNPYGGPGMGNNGTWYRRGNKIIIQDAF